MSMHHLAEWIDETLQSPEHAEEIRLKVKDDEDAIAEVLNQYVYPILEKTLRLIDEMDSMPHHAKLLADEIHDLLEGKFR